MRCPHVLAAAAVVVASSAQPALADYSTSAPIRPLTMVDPSGLTVVGIDLQLTRWTERPPARPAETDLTSLRLDVAADIKLAPHWLLLARVPMSHVSVEDDDCCELALGNVTIGGRGLWSTLFDSGTRAVTGGELSVSLPTASDGGERAVSAAKVTLTELPHDPGRYAPDTTTIRLTTLAQIYGRWLLAHAELGGQLYVYDDDAAGDDSSDLGLRLALAAGIRATYTVAILAELSAMVFSSDALGGGNDTVTSLDLGVRYGSDGAIVGIRAYVPLDAGLRDLDMLGVGLDAGVRF